jgi:ABC-2 type transport system ATP-binding protein
MSDTILRTTQLSKRYSRRILALDQLDLEVKRGQVFGLLGPNGSGKTTTLGLILGVIAKTHGSYSWFEQGDDYRLRKRIGAILEQPNLYPFLSARQNLIVHSRIKEIKKPDIDGLLKLVGLIERANDPFKTYSLGMKQRLAIASALLANPEVLIFDEPTNGLDPQGIAEIRQLIMEIHSMDKTIVLASHLLDEVQKVCSDFAVLRKGRMIYNGSVKGALESQNTIAVGADKPELLKQVLASFPGLVEMSEQQGVIDAVVKPEWTASALNTYLVQHNVPVNFIQPKKSSLEEKFLEILREDDQLTNASPTRHHR